MRKKLTALGASLALAVTTVLGAGVTATVANAADHPVNANPYVKVDYVQGAFENPVTAGTDTKSVEVDSKTLPGWTITGGTGKIQVISNGAKYQERAIEKTFSMAEFSSPDVILPWTRAITYKPSYQALLIRDASTVLTTDAIKVLPGQGIRMGVVVLRAWGGSISSTIIAADSDKVLKAKRTSAELRNASTALEDYYLVPEGVTSIRYKFEFKAPLENTDIIVSPIDIFSGANLVQKEYVDSSSQASGITRNALLQHKDSVKYKERARTGDTFTLTAKFKNEGESPVDGDKNTIIFTKLVPPGTELVPDSVKVTLKDGTTASAGLSVTGSMTDPTIATSGAFIRDPKRKYGLGGEIDQKVPRDVNVTYKVKVNYTTNGTIDTYMTDAKTQPKVTFNSLWGTPPRSNYGAELVVPIGSNTPPVVTTIGNVSVQYGSAEYKALDTTLKSKGIGSDKENTAQGKPVTVTYQVFKDDGVAGSATARAATGEPIKDISTLAVGKYSVKYTATDLDGNTATTLMPLEVTDLEDPAKPTISGPAAGTITKEPRPDISGTADAGTKLEVKDEAGKVICTVDSVPENGNWTCKPDADLPEGPVKLTATATGPTGKKSEPSDQSTITVDKTAPTKPEISGPADGSTVNTKKPEIAGTAEVGSKVEIKDKDDKVICTVPSVPEGGKWTCTPETELPEGANKLTATATDKAGNASPVSDEVNITVDATVPEAPVIGGPTDGNAVSIKKPVISGTAEAGTKLEVKDKEGKLICSVDPVPEGGKWACEPTEDLTDGAHKLTATATDKAGNTSPASSEVNITVDATPPAAPVITGPVTDSVLKDSKPEISGTAEAGTKLEVKNSSGKLICTVEKVPDNGVWSCIPNESLTEGDHKFIANAIDAAGNASPDSNETKVTVDTVKPEAPAITGPTDNQTVTSVRPPISGTAEPGTKIDVKDKDGNTVCTVASVPENGKWSCTPDKDLADGPHKLTATATDEAGNVSPVGKEVNITVDATAPSTPEITGPADGTAVSTKKPAIKGKGEAGTKVDVKDEKGNIICTVAEVPANGEWTCTPATDLDEGTHKLSAISTDKAGNPSPLSNLVGITVDTTAPQVPTVAGPKDGTVLQNRRPAISGTAEPGTKVEIKDKDGKVICTVDPVPANGNWTCTPATDLADGPHAFTATATDKAGNSSPVAGPVNVVVDNDAPAPPVIGGPADGSVSKDPTPTINGTGEPGATVTVKENDKPVCTATVDKDGKWSCTPATPLADGPHAFVASQQDAAGNPSIDSAKVTATIDTTAPAKPAVTGPKDGAVLNGNPPTLEGTAEPGSKVVVTDADGTTLCTVEKVGTDGKWSCTPEKELIEGAHKITATATDPAGNTSPASDPNNFTIDTNAPSAPDITGPGTPKHPAVIADTTPEISGTGETPGDKIKVTEGDKTICEATVAADKTWKCSPTEPMTDGAHNLTVTATDPAGNTSPASEPVKVTVDTTAPTNVTLNAPQPGAQKVTGTAEPGSKVVITDKDGNVLATVDKVGADGTYEAPLSRPAKAGETLTATVTDDAGNKATASAVPTDTVEPAPPSIDTTYGGDNKVTGTAEPGSKVTITDKDGKVIGEGTADPTTGKYNITTTRPLVADEEITAKAIDAAGNISNPAETKPRVKAPVVDPIKPGGKEITGTTSPNTPVTVTDKDGKVIGKGTAGPDGKFTVTTADGKPLDPTGGPFSVQAGDPAGMSATTKFLAPPTTDPIRQGDDKITGSAAPNSDIVLKDKDGNVIAEGKTDADGKFTIPVDPAKLPAIGEKLTVENTRGDLKVSAETSVAPAAPVIEPVKPGDTEIKGKTSPNTEVAITDKDGNVIGKATSDKDGNFTVTTPDGKPLDPAKGPYEATAKGPQGLETGSKFLVAPVVAPVKDGDNKISGVGAPNSKIVIKDENGNIIGEGNTDADGKYSVPVDTDKLPPVGGKINVENALGELSANTEVPVTPANPVVDPVKPGDTKVTGTTSPNTAVTVTDKDGNIIGTATAGPDGKFSVTTADGKPLNPATGPFTVTAGDPKGVHTDSKFLVPATVEPIHDGTDKVKGVATPGAKIVLKDKNGKVIAEGTAGPDGKYSIPVSADKLPAVGEKVAVETSFDGLTANSDSTVLPAVPVVDPVKPGDTKVTGKTSPKTQVTVTDKDGNIIGTATSGPDGKFAISTPDGKPLDPAKGPYTVTAGDPKGANATSKFLAPPTVGPLHQGDNKIAGVGAPNSKIVIKDKDGNVIGEGTTDENGKYAVTVPADKLPAVGDKITVENSIDGLTATGEAITYPAVPTVDPVNPGDTQVVGKTSPNTEVIISDKDGNVIGKGTSGPDGRFAITTLDGKPLSPALGPLSVTAKGPNDIGVTSKIGIAPVINLVKAGDKTISGVGMPGSTITITDEYGELVGAPVTVGSDGKYTVKVYDKYQVKKGQKLYATTVLEGVEDLASEITVGAGPSKPVVPGTAKKSPLAKTGADTAVLLLALMALLVAGAGTMTAKRIRKS